MSKYDRVVLALIPATAEKFLKEFEDYELVSVVNLNNRLVFTLQKERGAGRPKKVADGKDE